MDTVKKLFTSLYGEQLRRPHTSTIECHFDNYFDSRIAELERRSGGPARLVTPPTSTKQTPELEKWDAPPPPPIPGILRAKASSPAPPTSHLSPVAPDAPRPKSPSVLLTATKRPARGARGRRGVSSAHASSGEESPARSSNGAKKTGKKLRIWDADGNADEDDGAVLDYSTRGASTDDEGDRSRSKAAYVDQKEWGSTTSRGEFVLKDLDMEVNAILRQASEKEASSANTGYSAFSFLRNIVGGKTLTKADLETAMAAMAEHLSRKNVAREAALTLTSSVEASLIGQKTASFQSIEATVKTAVEAALRKILTPTNSLDLLREIQTKRAGPHGARPYVISIVGVNGVGKSTNLSKICFFLLQNKFRVLIAACDTFRSGAVEQLRVHARNLKELSQREGGVVELYEKGYGKDAANIAKDAVAHAQAEGFDVVLIDTAGRRHNDTRLMSSLEKFAKMAEPDKILMVGEALVGTDSVAQARNFNGAFGGGRGLDGFIISKCDTVGDMVCAFSLVGFCRCGIGLMRVQVGTLISMVFATGIPVVFLGTGQNYQDLRTLNIAWAVKLLMS